MQKEDLIIRVGGEITKLRLFKKVFVAGNGGAINLPKELIGKIVEIKYNNEKTK